MSTLTMVLRLGWRNIWRNPRRSLITLSAVATAYALLIGLIGLMEGLSEQLLRNGTLLLLGHLQVHDSSYLPDRNLNDTIGGPEQIDIPSLMADLRRRPGVKGVSARVYGFALVSTGEYSSGVQILGIEPREELQVTTLLSNLRPGSALPVSGERTIVLGQTLAEEIRARLGDEVAVVAQAADGMVGNDLFRVSGILHTGLGYLDRSMAVVHIRDLQELLSLAPGRIHEVAVLLRDAMSADLFAARLNASGSLPRHATADSWAKLSPQLREYLALGRNLNGFMIFLVALFAAFGMLNTTMMAVFERTREIGMLSSMGMKPWLILLTILLEIFLLTLVGLAAGFGFGAIIMSYLTTHGWDLSRWIGEMSMLGTRMDPVLKGAWAWDQVALAGSGLTIAALLAALLPARRVAWMPPVAALSAPTEG
jgi:ABC-type lipoprotein release transport system permease subunit